jgi:hypothetical protein
LNEIKKLIRRWVKETALEKGKRRLLLTWIKNVRKDFFKSTI